jgi:hypothetical protein
MHRPCLGITSREACQGLLNQTHDAASGCFPSCGQGCVAFLIHALVLMPEAEHGTRTLHLKDTVLAQIAGLYTLQAAIMMLSLLQPSSRPRKRVCSPATCTSRCNRAYCVEAEVLLSGSQTRMHNLAVGKLLSSCRHCLDV